MGSEENGAHPVEIIPGLLRVTLPLPFPPHDVNAWLLEEASGWTLIDCGVDDATTRALFERVLADPALRGKPVTRIIVTHFHPDHIGLAGWLAAKLSAPIHMSRVEWLQARLLLAEPAGDSMAQLVRHMGWCGAPEEFRAFLPRRGPLFPKWVGPLPASFARIAAGDRFRMAGAEWQVRFGEGHAPEMVCLYSPGRGVLIAADQILGRITPHIGSFPGEPFEDPLGRYLASLGRFSDLPADTLVLPSHGEPFKGLPVRLGELKAHHHERLERLRDFCTTPRTVMDTTAILFRKLPMEQTGFGISEALAHLRHLVARGEMVLETRDGVGHFVMG